MIINLKEEILKHNIKCEGIIHVGGHKGQEYEEYLDCGIYKQIWIEAIPSFYEEIKAKLINDENCLVINATVYDIEKEIYFNVANNGASSSILDLKKHKEYYPYIIYDGKIKMKTKRLDNLVKEFNIDLNLYNGLSIDVQGVELNVLKSFGNNLNNFSFIQSEVNVEELYEKCSLINEIDDYLKLFNFTRVSTKMWDDGAVGWGDALYIKKI